MNVDLYLITSFPIPVLTLLYSQFLSLAHKNGICKNHDSSVFRKLKMVEDVYLHSSTWPMRRHPRIEFIIESTQPASP